jgi:hypothetical protein
MVHATHDPLPEIDRNLAWGIGGVGVLFVGLMVVVVGWLV